jgi:holo-[acyl-carrier protein] synthase
LKFRDIEVIGNRGKPAKVRLKDPRALKMLDGREIIVSISHERDYSVAVALIK